MGKIERDTETGHKTKTAAPPAYCITVRKDDYTPVPYLTRTLARFFKLTAEPALFGTVDIHIDGQKRFGPYSRDVAETLAEDIVYTARRAGHPLLAFAERRP